jgi:transcriptional regulator with XRE-family HTH domain
LRENTVVVLNGVMNAYAVALTAYLKEARQADLGGAVGVTQATISRYASGERFPPREFADKVDEITEGKVPVAVWIAAAAKRFGLAA